MSARPLSPSPCNWSSCSLIVSGYWVRKRGKERKSGGWQASPSPQRAAVSAPTADCRQHHAARAALGAGRVHADCRVRAQRGLRHP